MILHQYDLRRVFFAILVIHQVKGMKMKIPKSEPTNKIEWGKQAKKTIDILKARVPNLNRAKNVIFFLGDGMGVPTLTTTRIVKAQKKYNSGPEEVLAWDKFPNTALIKTYNTDRMVPDSAGTATAYLTGAKTRKGMIGVDQRVLKGNCSSQEKHFETDSFLTMGGRLGHKVGVVTTARITHASPAAAYAHAADRDWEGTALDGCHDIAYQLAHGNHSVDVFMGGGLMNFFGNSTILPGIEPSCNKNCNGTRLDDENLVETWKKNQNDNKKKFTVAYNREEMMSTNTKKIDSFLGLFHASHMTWEEERNKSREPSLAEMTETAINILKDGTKGFLLFVEGGRIDHGHHLGRAKAALTECVAMEEAVVKALSMTSTSDTLVIVTADHSHTYAFGGYPARDANIFHVLEDTALDGANYTSLLYANGPGHRSNRSNSIINNEQAEDFEYKQDAAVPLKSETHGGEDVALFAKGPYAHLFAGVIEQSAIPHIIAFAACIENFGSSDLLLNASHCTVKEGNVIEGTDNAQMVIIIPVAIIAVVVVIGIVVGLVKHHKKARTHDSTKALEMTKTRA